MTIGQRSGIRSRSTGSCRARASAPRRREALETVGLAPAEQFLDKYPSDLSGGQKQRAVIARAMILNPVLLVADEPVSMLDMSVRAKILELMLELKREFDLSYLYITHDLATAKFFCDRIAIIYLVGRRDRPRRRHLRGAEAPLHAGAAPGDPRAGPAPRPSRATCLAARCRTPPARRSAARSTRAARVRSRSAGGRPATSATCSRRTGPGRGRSSTRPSGRSSATSTRSRPRTGLPSAFRRAPAPRRRPARDPRTGARGRARRAVLEGRAGDARGRGRARDQSGTSRVSRGSSLPGPVEVECHLYG